MVSLVRLLALAGALLAPAIAHGQPVKTDLAKGALFINMTTGDSWRGWAGWACTLPTTHCGRVIR